MRLFRLLSELKRRHVYQVAVAYAVTGFAILEAADLVLPALPVPGWVYRALVFVILAGFPVVVVLAWIFDITPEGVRRDAGSASVDGDDAESDGAGPPPDAAQDAGPPFRLPRGRPLLLGTLVIGLVGVGAWYAGRSASAMAPVVAEGSQLAVLPFAPAVPDSALERVGRELVVTLSSTLAGTADLATVEPLSVLANVPAGPGSSSLTEAREVAARLGADHFLHGALVRSGRGIRVEVSLYETAGRRLGTQSVTAEEVGALTDSATLAALRLIWTDAPATPPGLGALATGSLPALQAYLDGERAMAEGRWREAPTHFARAVAADSAFWYAYWRLQYTLEYHNEPVDSVVRARVWEHRRELMDRDRILVEARTVPLPEKIRMLQDATARFPTYWPAWWELADTYIHGGGYLGYTLDDSRAALDRTTALNPGFASAWSHLFWIATAARDTATMRQVIDQLSAARFDRVALQEAGINTLAFYQAQLAIARSGDGPPEPVIQLGVAELSGYRGPGSAENIASGLALEGFPAAQVELSRTVLERGSALPAMARAQHLALAFAWAELGRWDSALVAADAYAASAADPAERLVPYQLAVVGAWDGQVTHAAARKRRPPPAVAATASPEAAAEMAWLDGVLAFAVGDRTALRDARRALADTDSEWTATLDASLDGLARAVDGDTARAARGLAELELEGAAHWQFLRTGVHHPFMHGVNRLTAARWLLAMGDTLTARRMLPWHQVVLPAPLTRLRLANQVLAVDAWRLSLGLAESGGRARRVEELTRLLQTRRPEDATD